VELLASFRRVRIHTGAVNTQLIVDVSGSRLSSVFLSTLCCRLGDGHLDCGLHAVIVTTGILCWTYNVSQKNDSDIAHYNFNALILVIFGRDAAE